LKRAHTWSWDTAKLRSGQWTCWMEASEPPHHNCQTTDLTSHGDRETNVNGDSPCNNSVMKSGMHSSGTRIFTECCSTGYRMLWAKTFSRNEKAGYSKSRVPNRYAHFRKPVWQQFVSHSSSVCISILCHPG